MDLIFLDHTRFELGVLKEYTADIDLTDKKDFEIKTITDNPDRLKEKYWWYIDGTEYGGIVDQVSHDTASEEIIYTGRNFRGILATRIIEPETGEDFMLVDGNAGDVINLVLEQVGLFDLFVADETEIEINQYQFERYTDAYSGLIKMLDTVNSKMVMKYSAVDSKCHIKVELIDDYSDYLTYCRDNTIGFKIASNKGGVNHLICLGQGELKERYVIHLFADEYGALQPYATTENPLQDSDYILDKSQQVMFGLDEITEVYDASNAGLVENYLLLDKQPSDWSKNYNKYFKLDEDGDMYSEVESEETFVLQTTQPSDWAKKYQNYYQKDGSDYKSVDPVIVSTTYPTLSKVPSDWKKNYSNYYYKHDDGVQVTYPSVSAISYDVYKKEVRKPSDWETSYTNYYTITKDKKTGKKKYTQVQATSKKKAPSWKKNKYYTKYTEQKAPKFEKNYHRKKVEKSGSPTWTANKYYSCVDAAPVWNKGDYYRKVNDNYASLVEGGIDRLKELSNSESQQVELNDFDADIGDVVGGIDDVTGIEVCERITNMIITIQNDIATIQYSIGGE